MSGGKYGRGKAPERDCLKLEQWPAQDRDLWLLALQPVDPFASTGGERAGYSAQSNHKTASGYGRWLNCLTWNGNLDDSEAPHERITREHVISYIESLRALGNSSTTILSRLQELADAAKAFAPVQDWSFINRLAAKVRGTSKPVRDKRTKLASTDELYDLGLKLMAEATTQATPYQRALAYRDGLIIALLSLRPLRRKNAAGLRLGHSILKYGESWLIALPPEETKTHVPIEAEWPPSLVADLEHYLAAVRPLLMARQGRWKAPIDDALWVSGHGSPMTGMALYDAVRDRTHEGLGKKVNPHLFRDALATTIATETPELIGIAGPILGHRSPKTTEQFYQHAENRTAHKLYVAEIERQRMGSER